MELALKKQKRTIVAPDAETAEFERKRSRWLGGRYNNALDIAEAYTYFLDRTSGHADMGVDAESMVETMLIPSTGSSGGDRLVLLRSRRMTIERVIRSLDFREKHTWFIHRITGYRTKKIADLYDLPERVVKETIENADISLESILC